MKIYIQGFKSINNAQRVAIGKKLTFLVGPNSAGKSVAMLALQKLQGDSPAYKLDPTLLHQHSNPSTLVTSTQTLGLEWTHKKEEFGYYTTHCTEETAANILFSGELVSPIGFSEDFEKDDFSEQQFRAFTTSYIDNDLKYVKGGTKDHESEPFQSKSIASRLAAALDQMKVGRESFIINPAKNSHQDSIYNSIEIWLSNLIIDILDNGRYIEKPLYDHESMIKRATEQTLKNKEYLEALLEYLKESSIHQKLKWTPLEIKSIITRHLQGKERQKSLNTFEKFNAQIKRHIKSIDEKINASYPGKKIDVRVVSADRTLPKSDDIYATVRDDEKYTNIFHELMRTSAITSWRDAGVENIGTLSNTGIFLKQKSNPLELINKALAENLFLDNGYSIKVDSKILCSLDDWKRHDLSSETGQELLCRMYLIDSHGRELSFDDVGSGIGYVLPVLIESFRETSNGAIVFLQQPELHLHPALQASLTDVLIEACTDKHIVAETHSEHLILRALKRIRQTSAKTLSDPLLALQPSDVAVNYFEPLPDGSTKIHHLRISEDGDFIDRWPNGFFSERDKELFDE